MSARTNLKTSESNLTTFIPRLDIAITFLAICVLDNTAKVKIISSHYTAVGSILEFRSLVLIYVTKDKVNGYHTLVWLVCLQTWCPRSQPSILNFLSKLCTIEYRSRNTIFSVSARTLHEKSLTNLKASPFIWSGQRAGKQREQTVVHFVYNVAYQAHSIIAQRSNQFHSSVKIGGAWMDEMFGLLYFRYSFVSSSSSLLQVFSLFAWASATVGTKTDWLHEGKYDGN